MSWVLFLVDLKLAPFTLTNSGSTVWINLYLLDSFSILKGDPYVYTAILTTKQEFRPF